MMREEEGEMLKYVCTNEACPDEGVLQDVRPLGSSECPTCGWFMQAVA